MFRCLSGGSSGALLTTFQSRSNLVKLTPVITPTFFSPYHRTFRCLGLAGPPVMFSLNPSAGPRVSLSLCFSSSSRNCRPAPRARTPLRRRHSRDAPPLPHARSSCPTSPPRHAPALAHAPRLCPRHAAPPCAPLRRPHRAPSPSTSSAAASQHLRTRVPLLLCPTRAAAGALSHSLHPLIRRTQGAREIAS